MTTYQMDLIKTYHLCENVDCLNYNTFIILNITIIYSYIYIYIYIYIYNLINNNNAYIIFIEISTIITKMYVSLYFKYHYSTRKHLHENSDKNYNR